MNIKFSDIVLFIIEMMLLVSLTLFIGKTTITNFNISMERPWTALFFLLTVIVALIETK